MGYKLIDLAIMGDDRGSLVALEQNKNIPFEIKRVYYIFGTKPCVVRGKHAHYNLKQLVVAVSGSCKFLLDNGREQKTIELSKPNEGLYLEGLIWREMFDFSKDCVLMVLASDLYEETDYIRNYDEFLKIANA